MLTTYLFRYTWNAPFCSQIFTTVFASDGKRALTPLTKILRTFLVCLFVRKHVSGTVGRVIYDCLVYTRMRRMPLDTVKARKPATSLQHREPTNGPITIAIRARFEYDSTTIRLRFERDTTSYEELCAFEQ